jgi:hypothetical protein
MTDSPAWRPLPVAASRGVPALLVSAHFTRDSYAIHVTDLANIWSEVLDRKAIYRRSLAEDTSIDPTDSPQNMQQFLARVRSALEPAHPDHQSSRVTLEASSGDALTLKMTCDIPGLQPLKWPVHLGKSPASTLATELVLPLMQANLASERQISSLLEIIQHKDAVMGKLLDKLESTGTRLEHVFTTLPAKQKVTRKVAEEKITGLAPFKKGRWKAELLEDQVSPKDVASLADAVFGHDGLEYTAGLDVDTSPGLDGWWTSLEGPVSLARASEKTQREATPAPQPAEDDDDDFQVQSTPPQPSLARKAASLRDEKMKNDDSATEEDEAPPSLPQEPKRSRLGTIAARKRASPPPPPQPPPPPAQEGSETESEPASPEPADPEPPRQQQKKPALGRIGGGGASKAKQRSKSPETEAADAEAPPTDKPRRLGQIGRKPAAKAEDAAEAEGAPRGRRRADETSRAAPPPRETSEERANRKRDELQKELERKAAAGPARKKRKF